MFRETLISMDHAGKRGFGWMMSALLRWFSTLSWLFALWENQKWGICRGLELPKSQIHESWFTKRPKKRLQSAAGKMNSSERQEKCPEIRATIVNPSISKLFLHSHVGPAGPADHSARVQLHDSLSTSGRQTDLIGQSVHWFSYIWDMPTLLCVTWNRIVEWTLPSHQALFNPGNHPCPYVCSPGSCHDNSLCLLRLLFMEWHLNDHFMDHWNPPMWIKKYRTV